MNVSISPSLFRRPAAAAALAVVALGGLMAASGCRHAEPADLASSGTTGLAASAPKSVDPQVNAQIQQGIQAGMARGRAEAEAHRSQATAPQPPAH